MLIHSSGKQYVAVAFLNEQELEDVVLCNHELLFGDLSIILPKKKISTADGAGTIPDGIVIDLRRMEWLLLEAELAHHGVWTHIAPQISKQVAALRTQANKDKLITVALELIAADTELLDRCSEMLGLGHINIQQHIQKIFATEPIVAIPIDHIPADLTSWASTLAFEVKIWKIGKYIETTTKEILYELPDEALPVVDTVRNTDPSVTVSEARTPNDVYQNLFTEGLLVDGDEVTMKYGPKSGQKTIFTGIARSNGIQYQDQVYSPSTAALLCIRSIRPERAAVNGWQYWKGKTGETLSQLAERLPQ